MEVLLFILDVISEALLLIMTTVLEVLSKLFGSFYGYAMVGFIVLSFVSSAVEIVVLIRRKFNKLFKVFLIISCAVVFLVMGLAILLMVDGYRIGRGAESFLNDAISAISNGELPPISSKSTEEQKMQIQALLNKLPRENYKIEFSDSFGDIKEYYIHFENGKSFFAAVEAEGTFLTLFAKARYKLYTFRETEEIQVENR